MTILYAWMADAVVALHLGFVLFVLLGGALAFHWRRMPMLHLPVVLWAVLLEAVEKLCFSISLRSAQGCADGFQSRK